MGKARNEEVSCLLCGVLSVILCNVCGVFNVILCNYILSFSYHEIFYNNIGHAVALHAHILFSTWLMIIMQYRKSFGLKCVGVL